jgi:hypothetical protein
MPSTRNTIESIDQNRNRGTPTLHGISWRIANKLRNNQQAFSLHTHSLAPGNLHVRLCSSTMAQPSQKEMMHAYFALVGEKESLTEPHVD